MIDYKNHIESNPEIMVGKPCIKGTRIPVDMISNKINNGYSVEDLLDAYPRITKEDIEACMIYEEQEIKHALIIHSKNTLSKFIKH
jgi:uncharacterized protein (DUF433 family)